MFLKKDFCSAILFANAGKRFMLVTSYNADLPVAIFLQMGQATS